MNNNHVVVRDKIKRDLTNHPPSDETQGKMEIVRRAYHDVVRAVSSMTNGAQSRELSLSMTNLEQSLMWAIAHLARTDFDERQDTPVGRP